MFIDQIVSVLRPDPLHDFMPSSEIPRVIFAVLVQCHFLDRIFQEKKFFYYFCRPGLFHHQDIVISAGLCDNGRLCVLAVEFAAEL